jgi:hypothetical protein
VQLPPLPKRRAVSGSDSQPDFTPDVLPLSKVNLKEPGGKGGPRCGKEGFWKYITFALFYLSIKLHHQQLTYSSA